MSRKATVLPFDQSPHASDRQRYVQSLFDEHHKALQRFVVRLGVNEQNCQDIVQGAYLRVMRQSNPESEIRSPFTYLCTIAANLVRDQTRKSVRSKTEVHQSDDETVLVDDAPTPDQIVDTSQKIEVLKKALLALPRNKQQVLLLNQYQGMSCRQISDKTGMPLRTVQRYLNDALLFCKSKMRAYHE